MKRNIIHVVQHTIIVSFLFSSSLLFAQEENKKDSSNLYKFTVEQDILNLKFEGDTEVKIKSASGREESINKTPYAASVLTKEDIENSGALTIPEALRLAPGLFVQQTTNGLYEVYLLGRESLPGGATTLSDSRSKMVLVMINNMPVNNYFDGGVLWETLPVSVSDIERIEIVRSPSNVFFGRDAASGIINIITKTPESNKLNIQGGTQRSVMPGNAQTAINHASATVGIRDKFLVRLSGTYNTMRRFQDPYYVFSATRYVPADSLLFYQSTADKTNPSGSLGRQDYGINSYVRYVPSEKVEIEASLSTQQSEAQAVYGGFEELALTHRKSSLNRVNLNSKIYNLNTQISYGFGSQNLASGYAGNRFDVNSINARMYYTVTIKNIRIIPGASYQRFGFNDASYQSTDSHYPNIIAGNKYFYNYGYFLKAGAAFLENKLSIDVGARKDLFNVNNQSVISYQAAVAYSPVEILSMHLSYSTGYMGTYAKDNFDVSTRMAADGSTIKNIANHSLTGTNTRNLTAGTRINVTDKILLGVEYFNISNSNLLQSKSFIDTASILTYQRVNSDVKLKRKGLTTSLSANLSGKFKVRVFATWQQTTFKNDSTHDKHLYTPKYYGGLTATFHTLLDKLNVSASLYLYSTYDMKTTQGDETIASKIIPNIKVSYKFWQESTVFINARNFAGATSHEFIFSDNVPAMYLVGVNLNF
jgi:iron complex outermembrane receptor protein